MAQIIHNIINVKLFFKIKAVEREPSPQYFILDIAERNGNNV